MYHINNEVLTNVREQHHLLTNIFVWQTMFGSLQRTEIWVVASDTPAGQDRQNGAYEDQSSRLF